MSAQHTPGPWRLDDASEHPANLIEREYHFIDAGNLYPPSGFSLSGLMSEANAHLIAAAPELYTALKVFMTCFPSAIAALDDEHRDQITNAIAKAEGRV